MRCYRLLKFYWIFLAVFWLPTCPAMASDNELFTEQIAQLQRQLNTVEDQLREQTPTASALRNANKTLGDLNNKINSAIVDLDSENQKIAEQITSLGQAIAAESEAVKDKRQSLENQKLETEKWLSQYRLLSLRSDELLTDVKNQINVLLEKRFFHKGPTIIELSYFVIDTPGQTIKICMNYIVQHHGLNRLSVANYLFLVIIATLSLAISIWLRSRISRLCTTKQWSTSFISTFFRTFSISTARYLPGLVFTIALAFILYSFLNEIQPVPLLALLAYTLPFLILSIYLIRLFLSPKHPATMFLPIPEKVGRRLAYKVDILAVIGFISFLLISILYIQHAPQPILRFWQDGFVLLAVVNLIWIVVYSRHIPQLSQKIITRMIIVVALLVLLMLELLGYRNLVFAMFRVGLAALAGFVVVVILHRISKDFYDGLDHGVQPWHKKIRSKLGLKTKQPVPGMTFVRLATLLLLWGGFAFFTIGLFDFSGEIRRSIASLLVQGITLGDMNINFSRIFLAIIVFSLLYALSSWFKAQLERQWLSKTNIDRGAKDALVTISGYIGVALALVIALSLAGVTFTNFAIVAGALSVGIGFGLQNIVNNFVSGLILLFERPIKNGDWIIVGSTEGYVKKISIRSTQIQTFDRADIIVPNSELVSTQVTNWMLYDRIGRIRVPVGVAYGSDTEKVRQLLLDVAMAHAHVIKDSQDYKISVFFLRFGDSSLDFELRCFIEDIDKTLTVKSDLNFAIDKIFKENAIEIPFPQRDIHVKSASDSADNIVVPGDTN